MHIYLYFKTHNSFPLSPIQFTIPLFPLLLSNAPLSPFLTPHVNVCICEERERKNFYDKSHKSTFWCNSLLFFSLKLFSFLYFCSKLLPPKKVFQSFWEKRNVVTQLVGLLISTSWASSRALPCSEVHKFISSPFIHSISFKFLCLKVTEMTVANAEKHFFFLHSSSGTIS